MMFITAITPKCTGSIPSACAVGSSTGRMTRMIVVPSRKQPRTSSRTLTTSRNTSGDISYAFRIPLSVRGMFSTVMT